MLFKGLLMHMSALNLLTQPEGVCAHLPRLQLSCDALTHELPWLHAGTLHRGQPVLWQLLRHAVCGLATWRGLGVGNHTVAQTSLQILGWATGRPAQQTGFLPKLAGGWSEASTAGSGTTHLSATALWAAGEAVRSCIAAGTFAAAAAGAKGLRR